MFQVLMEHKMMAGKATKREILYHKEAVLPLCSETCLLYSKKALPLDKFGALKDSSGVAWWPWDWNLLAANLEIPLNISIKVLIGCCIQAACWIIICLNVYWVVIVEKIFLCYKKKINSKKKNKNRPLQEKFKSRGKKKRKSCLKFTGDKKHWTNQIGGWLWWKKQWTHHVQSCIWVIMLALNS